MIFGWFADILFLLEVSSAFEWSFVRKKEDRCKPHSVLFYFIYLFNISLMMKKKVNTFILLKIYTCDKEILKFFYLGFKTYLFCIGVEKNEEWWKVGLVELKGILVILSKLLS